MDLRTRMRQRIPQAGSRWYDIKALAAGRAVVRIYQEIGYWGITAEDFATELAGLSASEIEVQINSPGGDVFDGMAIYNALRLHPARVTTRVDGIAASAASIIAQAGDVRVMTQHSQMMIHEAWGMAMGPASELRDFADLLDKQNDVLAQVYADRAGREDRPAAWFRALMAQGDTYLSDVEAVDHGLADEIYIPERQPAPGSAAQQGDVRADIADDLEVVAEPAGGLPGITTDAARVLLAAFTLEGVPS